MGWRESPPLFFSASETARDLIKAFLQRVILLEHYFENRVTDTAQDSTSHHLTDTASFINILEVFVDEFIGMTKNSSQDHLCHFTRIIFIGIHYVFPPPEVLGHQGQDPIFENNLDQGEGTWATTKDILAWLLNGETFTLQLMRECH